MADLRPQYNEEAVGANHPTKEDVINRAWNVEHEEDGTHTGDKIIKAWIQFNGTGVIAIQDSFNVSGIVDNGVGDYTVTWDTDFANDDYAATANDSGYTVEVDTFLTTSLRIKCWSQAPAQTDRAIVTVIAIGDQA